MMSTKQCLYCNNEFKEGRTDRKYCNDLCRAAYHNQQRRLQQSSVQKINAILKKNLSILKRLSPEGYSVVRKTTLSEQGYNFNYFTNVYRTKDQRLYFFCYDRGFAVNQDKIKVTIVQWQAYMQDYQLPLF